MKPRPGVYAPHKPDIFAQLPFAELNGIDTETVIAHEPSNA